MDEVTDQSAPVVEEVSVPVAAVSDQAQKHPKVPKAKLGLVALVLVLPLTLGAMSLQTRLLSKANVDSTVSLLPPMCNTCVGTANMYACKEIGDPDTMAFCVNPVDINSYTAPGSYYQCSYCVEPTATPTRVPTIAPSPTRIPTSTSGPLPTPTPAVKPTSTIAPTIKPTSTRTPTPKPISTRTPTPKPTSTRTPTPTRTP